MPAEYAAKAAAMLIAMNAIAAPLPEVSAETSTVTFVEVLAGPEQAASERRDSSGPTVNAGCGDY
jgi:hypothetical protein